MTQYTFFGGANDITTSVQNIAGISYERVMPNSVITCWSAKTGGTQYTLTLNSVAVASITSDANGYAPAVLAPDGVLSMWADAGAGRVLVYAYGVAGPPGVGPVSSVVGQVGTITGAQIAADTTVAGTFAPISGSANYVAKANMAINVLRYGTNDTAVRAALADAVTAGKSLYFPAVTGGYAVTGNLIINPNGLLNQAGPAIIGDGAGSIIAFTGGGLLIDASGGGSTKYATRSLTRGVQIRSDGTAGPALYMKGSGTSGVVRWRCDDTYLLGPGPGGYNTGANAGTGLQIDGSYIGTFTGLYVHGFNKGLVMQLDTINTAVGVNAVNFVGGEIQSNNIAADISSLVGVNFFGTTIEGHNASGVEVWNGSKSVNFFGCYFETNGQTAATLSSTLSTGAPITALPVNATTVAIPNGATVTTIPSGSNAQPWVTTSAVAIGATSIPVSSQTPNFAYPSGSSVNQGWDIKIGRASDATTGSAYNIIGCTFAVGAAWAHDHSIELVRGFGVKLQGNHWGSAYTGTGVVYVNEAAAGQVTGVTRESTRDVGNGYPAGIVNLVAGTVFGKEVLGYEDSPYAKSRGVLRASSSLTFSTVAAGATTNLTVTVTGAAVGDDVTIHPNSIPEAGLVFQGTVSATNTVNISCTNASTGSITPTARTWRVNVWTF